MSNLETVMAFLQGKGLTGAQAAGVAGNLTVEDPSLDPTDTNPAEGAVGIAQWEGGRRAGLQSYAARTGGSETDLNTQLGYLWSEFQGSESSAYRKLLTANDPATAATVVDQYYERSSGSTRAKRVANAQAIYNGSPPGGVSSSTGAHVQNVGLWSWVSGGWADDVYRIALEVAGGALAGVLVIVGLKEAMRGQGS